MLSKKSGYKVTLSILPLYPRSDADYSSVRGFLSLINYLATTHKRKSVRSLPYSPVRLRRPVHTGHPMHSDKISIKIMQLASSPHVALERFRTIVSYAKARHVFVWISAVMQDTLALEYDCYMRMRAAGYRNVGLTVATYNTSAIPTIERILRIDGHVRLVKGHYRGNISDWHQVTTNYIRASKLLIDSAIHHTLATHDFAVLRQLYDYNPRFTQTIEFAFFYEALPHVEKQLSAMPFVPIYKTLYMAQGDYLQYALRNLKTLDVQRHLERKVRVALYRWSPFELLRFK